MSFLQPWMLLALPLIALPIIIHLINQWRYQTKQWGAMMFLLKANKMARGYAKLRQWLILAMRCLVVAGLIFAIARPLASGLLGWTGGGRADTTILLLDRSPSMQQVGEAGVSKLQTGRQQLADTLETLGSTRWVLIDSAEKEPQTFETVKALVDSPAMKGSSATADIPGMLQSTVDYLKANQPGATEVWLCSDLRSPDWNPDSGNWAAIREAFSSLPQSVRFHLLAYPETEKSNVAVRVSDVRRENGPGGNSVVMTIRLARSDASEQATTVPVQIELDGARSTLEMELSGQQVELRDHRVPLSGRQERGWGRVSIQADTNDADNEFFFVFDDPPQRRIVLVGEDENAVRALQIAASVSPDGKSGANVEFVTPQQLDSLVLDDAALLIWQTDLPDNETSGAVREYVNKGGQVIFFPPDGLVGGIKPQGEFLGVSWSDWVRAEADSQVMVENWRGDQDLLAATRSGTGLPVGQLEVKGYATIKGELSQLATLTGGAPLLGRLTTDKGGVYFCTTSTAGDQSSFAKNGIVMYVVVQRAISQGLSALGQTVQRVAGNIAEPTEAWRQVAGPTETLSSQYAFQSGVYQVGEAEDAQWLAVNRSLKEDQRDTLADKQLSALFAGLDFSRVDDSAGSLSGIVREIWRVFLLLMIAAMLLEALLCIPRRSAAKKAASITTGFAPKSDGGRSATKTGAAA
ncbi:MAG: BatA domain-containing protein [Pirellulaceae bacterium]